MAVEYEVTFCCFLHAFGKRGVCGRFVVMRAPASCKAGCAQGQNYDKGGGNLHFSCAQGLQKQLGQVMESSHRQEGRSVLYHFGGRWNEEEMMQILPYTEWLQKKWALNSRNCAREVYVFEHDRGGRSRTEWKSQLIWPMFLICL
eukprot:TRINITY_DN70608_c0_g1_i1.p2 TRINITY_DN70608_c0_g1~~TRINITY_DN70608_c0_g1_i1.p2  ORF type:complete len:145 (+),score=10.54 TRINITY_DN70608_c0_g1_i1:564-998(+)